MWFYPGRKQKEIGKKISSANGIANYLYYYRFFPLSFFTELRPFLVRSSDDYFTAKKIGGWWQKLNCFLFVM